MTYCGIGDLAVAIDVEFQKASEIDLKAVVDDLWSLREDPELRGVTFDQIGLSFGEIDATVYVKTPLEVIEGTNPTWRLALAAQKVLNHKNVKHVKSRIIIHDRDHEMRQKTAG